MCGRWHRPTVPRIMPDVECSLWLFRSPAFPKKPASLVTTGVRAALKRRPPKWKNHRPECPIRDGPDVIVQGVHDRFCGRGTLAEEGDEFVERPIGAIGLVDFVDAVAVDVQPRTGRQRPLALVELRPVHHSDRRPLRVQADRFGRGLLEQQGVGMPGAGPAQPRADRWYTPYQIVKNLSPNFSLGKARLNATAPGRDGGNRSAAATGRGARS